MHYAPLIRRSFDGFATAGLRRLFMLARAQNT
jgi:hypothetical protein